MLISAFYQLPVIGYLFLCTAGVTLLWSHLFCTHEHIADEVRAGRSVAVLLRMRGREQTIICEVFCLLKKSFISEVAISLRAMYTSYAEWPAIRVSLLMVSFYHIFSFLCIIHLYFMNPVF
uniref:ABC transmembrane type-1 domain-containing protein n=1 Tax=Ascaris lumbricoides TaxID=6252 RepID=A0A0M3HFC1_ASCLU